jgi:hypothetical protein
MMEKRVERDDFNSRFERLTEKQNEESKIKNNQEVAFCGG